MAYLRYVAIGDSTTEGLEDPYPDGSGYRGWADRLAERIAAASPGLLYANLAVRGKLARQVRDEQLAPALALEPDLATVVAGLNDTLRPRCDLHLTSGHLEAMIRALRAQGATVVTMTFPDPVTVNPLARVARARVLAYNERIRDVAGRHGALIVDLEQDGTGDRRLWHVDRLHANSDGHARMADAFAEAIGLEGASRAWTEPLPPRAPIRRPRALMDNVTWMGVHLAPWVLRRIRGVSSGDGLPPKRPVLELVRPDAAERSGSTLL
jgi:lysophospholipase L1-like esterase